MFGVSFSEILLIALLSLVVFGPKQLPQIARTIGTFLGSIYYYFNRIRQEFYQQSGFHELTKAKQDLINSYQNWTNPNTIEKTIEENITKHKPSSSELSSELLPQVEDDWQNKKVSTNIKHPKCNTVQNQIAADKYQAELDFE